MPTVAYLGPEKTNTYFAARKEFGEKGKYIHAPTVEDVFRLVEREKADFGVVPVENSLEGSVTRTLDRFTNFKNSLAKVFGEIDLPIQHHFITRRGADRKKIEIVYSHPQALGQCGEWLGKNVPRATRLQETSSTAEAIEALLRDNLLWEPEEQAAIGRRELAMEHGLAAVPIPVSQENRTRFLVLSLKTPKRRKKNKTSLMFALKDKPGALHDALMPFKHNRINLTKIESRPSKRRAWEYVFFVDLEGHESEPRVKKALRELERQTAQYRVLGSYPWGGSHGRG